MFLNAATASFILAASAQAASIARRDGPHGGHGMSPAMAMPKGPAPLNLKAVKIQNVAPKVRWGARHQIIRYGPLTLPGMKPSNMTGGHMHGGAPGQAMDPNGYAFVGSFVDGICSECTVLTAAVDVVLPSGKRADIANGVYLHHLVSNLEGKKPQPDWVTLCPGPLNATATNPAAQALKDLQGNGFVGGAVDAFTDWFTAKGVRDDSGLHIPKGVKTTFSGEIVNYKTTPQEVYLQLEMEWLPGIRGVESIKTPLNVEGCDFSTQAFKDALKKSPKGQIPSKEFTVLTDGTIIMARGHMHDGGDFLKAYVNGELMCNSKAIYGAAPDSIAKVDGKEWKTISKMTECSDGFDVYRGDKIKLVAGYDNIAHPARMSHGEAQENMGFMVFTFVSNEE